MSLYQPLGVLLHNTIVEALDELNTRDMASGGAKDHRGRGS